MSLTVQQLNTDTWEVIQRELKSRLERLRNENDSPSKTPEQTALLRGQIKEIKLMLKMDTRQANEIPAPAPGIEL
jgi:hypothetical protein